MTIEDLRELLVLAINRTSTLDAQAIETPGVIGIETDGGEMFFLEIREA